MDNDCCESHYWYEEDCWNCRDVRADRLREECGDAQAAGTAWIPGPPSQPTIIVTAQEWDDMKEQVSFLTSEVLRRANINMENKRQIEDLEDRIGRALDDYCTLQSAYNMSQGNCDIYREQAGKMKGAQSQCQLLEAAIMGTIKMGQLKELAPHIRQAIWNRWIHGQ